MYPNLKAEIARRGWSATTICEKLNMAPSTFSNKMKNGTFTLTEAKQIKTILEWDHSLEELFEEAC
jgi:IS30 family transposase